MRLNDVDFSGARPIDGYGPGFFRVGGHVHHGAILILPAGVFAWDGYEDTARLHATVRDIDLLFVGTGAEVTHIPPRLRNGLEEAGLGVESMASPQACRTYNVLLSEGRRVGAALLPV